MFWRKKCSSNESGEALKSTLLELVKVAKETLVRLDDIDNKLAKLTKRILNVERTIVGANSDSESARIAPTSDEIRSENNPSGITS